MVREKREMSDKKLTAPETAKIERRVKSDEEDEIPTATNATTTSSVAVESPKRRMVEAAESEPAAKQNRFALTTSFRKHVSRTEKNDSATDDSRRLRRFSFGPSSTGCSEEESSGSGFESVDPAEAAWFKSDNNSVVSISGESEVCTDLPGNEMESKSRESTQRQSTVFATPTAEELEEFFLAAEKTVAQRFKDKYNFDVVNEVPVKEGRFEWSPVKH